MPSNIEIKTRVPCFPKTLQLAQKISDVPVQIFDQEDTFFRVAKGRLKLRVINNSKAELIFYERSDHPEPKESNYRIFPVQDPPLLKTILMDALGIQGVVKKRRQLFLLGQTRIHLDDVEGLGQFVELEYVLQPSESLEDGLKVVREIMAKLQINEENLLAGAYLDLL
jgi:predicted adenylyl cyclase CyaB